MKHAINTIFILICSAGLFAQETTKPDATGFIFEAGRRTLSVTPGNLQFAYVDESPSQDYLYTNVKIGSDYAYDIGMGLNVDGPKQNFKMVFHGIFGQINGGAVEFAMGYKLIRTRHFYLSPKGTFSFGSAGMKIGDIENNASYIQVNDSKFYSNNVSVRVRNRFMGLKPSIELGLYTPWLPFKAILFEAGYNLIGPLKSELKFEGDDEKNSPIKEFEDTDAQNVSFIVNSKPSQDLPIKFSGPYFGVSVVISKLKSE